MSKLRKATTNMTRFHHTAVMLWTCVSQVAMATRYWLLMLRVMTIIMAVISA